MRQTIRHQQGATLIETCLMLIPVMLAIGLAIEISHASQIRHIATLALYQAGRVASVTQAHPIAMHAAFRQAIAPLFIAYDSRKQSPEQTQARVRHAERQRYARTQLPLWHLDILSPTKESFQDFSDPVLSRAHSHPVIRNDYLAEQHHKHVTAGWTAGRGPHSGQTIFQANTLVLRLTFLYPPSVPGLKLLLKVLSTLGARRQDLIGQAWRQGLMASVIYSEAMMQSNLMAWDQQPQPETRLGPAHVPSKRPYYGPQPFNALAPALAQHRSNYPETQESLSQRNMSFPSHTLAAPARQTASAISGQPEPVQTNIKKEKSDQTASELCGVLLCCIESD